MDAVLEKVWAWLHYTHLTSSERARFDTHAWRDARVETATVAHSSGWTSWSLTEILYRRDDVMSRLFALSSFLPLVVVLFLSGLASAPAGATRQPALMLLMFLVLSVALNVALKSIIRSPRPVHPASLPSACLADRTRISYSTEHGMPSDHAQFTTFFVCYLIFKGFGSRRTQRSTRRRRQSTRSGLSNRQACFFVLIDAVVCVGRVYNGYHTVVQVLVGAMIGAALAAVCVQEAARKAMYSLTAHVITPIMLFFTSWTDLLY